MIDTTTITATAAVGDGELQKGNSTTIADWEKDEPAAAAAAAAANPNIDMITSSKFTYERVEENALLGRSDDRIDATVPTGSVRLETWNGRGYMAGWNPYPQGLGSHVCTVCDGENGAAMGSDCLEFKPERWLDDNGVFQPQSPYKYTL
jgi:hypothetical protein